MVDKEIKVNASIDMKETSWGGAGPSSGQLQASYRVALSLVKGSLD